MSSGGPVSTTPNQATVNQAVDKAASEAAAAKKKSLRQSSESKGSSILTSGAGILEDQNLKKNLLGAGAYNRNQNLG